MFFCWNVIVDNFFWVNEICFLFIFIKGRLLLRLRFNIIKLRDNNRNLIVFFNRSNTSSNVEYFDRKMFAFSHQRAKIIKKSFISKILRGNKTSSDLFLTICRINNNGDIMKIEFEKLIFSRDISSLKESKSEFSRNSITVNLFEEISKDEGSRWDYKVFKNWNSIFETSKIWSRAKKMIWKTVNKSRIKINKSLTFLILINDNTLIAPSLL